MPCNAMHPKNGGIWKRLKALFGFYDSKVPLRSLKNFFLEYSFVLSFADWSHVGKVCEI
jgi:hypothetical protein